MKIIQYLEFPHTPFSIEVSEIKNEPGVWDSTKVAIFRGEDFIGEYIRNMSDYSKSTFYPFMVAGAWYALYSADYTATRIMKLNEKSIEDWCGEDSDPHGFCPTEFYIPRYIHTSPNAFSVDCDIDQSTFDLYMQSPNMVTTESCDFGFLSGCVWGDDSSWKLKYVDLSRVPEKELSITEKFGHWVLPDSLTLKECVTMTTWQPTSQIVNLIKTEAFKLGE